MSEQPSNVPSIEEISFKLTDNLIPSVGNSKGTLIPLESSLEYTISRISIQQMLAESADEEENQRSHDWKQSVLKSTSANATLSSLKQSQNLRIKHRAISSRKSQGNPEIDRRLSMHVFNFQNECPSARSALIHGIEHHGWPEKHRTRKSNYRRQSLFGTRRTELDTSKKSQIKQCSIFELGRSIHIKQLTLKENSAKQKIYLQRIIMNRGSTVHALQELSRCPPLWNSRKTCHRL